MPATSKTTPEAAAKNRKAFRALLLAHDLLIKEGSDLIELQTGRPCSYRAVKSWLADPEEASTARPCPTWAVDALRAAVLTPDLIDQMRAKQE